MEENPTHESIAEYRAKYFDKFVGCPDITEVNSSHWYGMTPEDAMQLADKSVTWLYSDINPNA